VRLSVPEGAVLETGERSLVFVDRGEGAFEPREVEVGLRVQDRWEIVSGLRPGEMVLTSGQFFVDSESKIEAASLAMREAPAAEPPAGGPAQAPR
jgi:membrane fusion protein, copper/silver efflux system